MRALLGLCLILFVAPAQAGTIEDIHARGTVQCGVRADIAGISVQKDGAWSGIAIDFCRALAGAVRGDAKLIAIVPLSEADEDAALQAGEVDVLIVPRAWRFAHDMDSGTMPADALHFSETPSVQTQPVMRQGDDGWYGTVRWVRHVLVAAERLGVTQDMARTGEVPPDWLEGPDGEAGATLGLAKDWMVQAIAAAGNLREMHERNLGAGPRGQNALTRDGGLMWAPDSF